jgi:hypothetical protein
MAVGTYGIKKLANVDLADIEIIYTYSPSRDALPTTEPQTLDPQDVLNRVNDPIKGSGQLLDGWYNLRLPSDTFTSLGFYNIIIRPRTIITTISDCGSLAAFPDKKGIVIQSSGNVTDLVGSRVDYPNASTTGLFRIITSANRVEPVNQNLPNTTQKSVRYRFNDNSSLTFLTLTPSSAPNVKPNSFPFIGQPNDTIYITKTNFDPIMIEVELAEHDIDTLAIGLYGNQSKSIADGKYTLYDFNNNIYKQYNLYEIQDQFTGEPLFEIREETDDIDETKDFDTITTPQQ